MYGDVWKSFRRSREQSEAEEVEEEKSKKKQDVHLVVWWWILHCLCVYFPGNSKGNIMDVKGL